MVKRIQLQVSHCADPASFSSLHLFTTVLLFLIAIIYPYLPSAGFASRNDRVMGSVWGIGHRILKGFEIRKLTWFWIGVFAKDVFFGGLEVKKCVDYIGEEKTNDV
jgi:hypothetical protein